jgi:hypothetical protein
MKLKCETASARTPRNMIAPSNLPCSPKRIPPFGHHADQRAIGQSSLSPDRSVESSDKSNWNAAPTNNAKDRKRMRKRMRIGERQK